MEAINGLSSVKILVHSKNRCEQPPYEQWDEPPSMVEGQIIRHSRLDMAKECWRRHVVVDIQDIWMNYTDLTASWKYGLDLCSRPQRA